MKGNERADKLANLVGRRALIGSGTKAQEPYQRLCVGPSTCRQAKELLNLKKGSLRVAVGMLTGHNDSDKHSIFTIM